MSHSPKYPTRIMPGDILELAVTSKTPAVCPDGWELAYSEGNEHGFWREIEEALRRPNPDQKGYVTHKDGSTREETDAEFAAYLNRRSTAKPGEVIEVVSMPSDWMDGPCPAHRKLSQRR